MTVQAVSSESRSIARTNSPRLASRRLRWWLDRLRADRPAGAGRRPAPCASAQGCCLSSRPNHCPATDDRRPGACSRLRQRLNRRLRTKRDAARSVGQQPVAAPNATSRASLRAEGAYPGGPGRPPPPLTARPLHCPPEGNRRHRRWRLAGSRSRARSVARAVRFRQTE